MRDEEYVARKVAEARRDERQRIAERWLTPTERVAFTAAVDLYRKGKADERNRIAEKVRQLPRLAIFGMDTLVSNDGSLVEREAVLAIIEEAENE
jgi:hypothetical protein